MFLTNIILSLQYGISNAKMRLKMESIIPRFFKAAKESFFMFGPRGTGKSTWLRTVMKNALWVDLLDPEVFRSYSARPERL